MVSKMTGAMKKRGSSLSKKGDNWLLGEFQIALAISCDANLPLVGEFLRFCCQNSHFRELSKSVETILGGWGCAMHIQVVQMKLIDCL